MDIQEACDLLKISPDKSLEEIKSAYNDAIFQYHPDTMPKAAEEIKTIAAEKSKIINEAFNLIREYKKNEKLNITTKEVTICSEGYGDFEAISDGLREINDGDKICILPGSYEESLNINKSIEIIGESNELNQKAILKSNDIGIIVNNSKVTINNIIFESETSIIAENKSNLVVDSCIINSDSAGLCVLEESNINVKNCIIEHACTGILIEDGGLVEIDDNRIAECRFGVDIQNSKNIFLRNNNIEAIDACVICYEKNNDISVIKEMIENGNNIFIPNVWIRGYIEK